MKGHFDTDADEDLKNERDVGIEPESNGESTPVDTADTEDDNADVESGSNGDSTPVDAADTEFHTRDDESNLADQENTGQAAADSGVDPGKDIVNGSEEGSKPYPEGDVQDAEEVYLQASEAAPPRKSHPKTKLGAALAAVIIVVLLLLAASSDTFEDWFDDDNGDDKTETPEELEITYREPVMLHRELVALGEGTQIYPEGTIGYEPSLAVDSSGAMFYTAHKDLRWQESWDYTASWWFITTDDGLTWRNPDDIIWNGIGDTLGMKDVWAGDEGDIAVDQQDRIYYIDTYLEDNNFHVFSDHGDTYEGSKRHQTTALDDRPWLTAQGDGILHYLGNNGVSVGDGRYWYYRSTDGGATFSPGLSIVSGWASIDAERAGNHVYIGHEGSDAENDPDVFLYYSDDRGVTWNWDDRTYVGPMVRNGVGEGWPTVFHGSGGAVYVIWQDSPQGGAAPGTLYLSYSDDYGRSFDYWDISMPEGAVYLYPTVNVCQYGEYHDRNRLGISFYATTDIPVDENSKWYLYAAVAENPTNGTRFDFQVADPNVLYTGNDLHALHDFFEIVIAPDGSINIAYQMNVGEHPYEDGEEQRYLMFVRGDVEET